MNDKNYIWLVHLIFWFLLGIIEKNQKPDFLQITVFSGAILFEVFTGNKLLATYTKSHIKEHAIYNEAIFMTDMKKQYNSADAFQHDMQQKLQKSRKETDPEKNILMDLIIQLLKVKKEDRINWDSFVCHPYINPRVCYYERNITIFSFLSQ